MNTKLTTKLFVLFAVSIILIWDGWRDITVGYEGTISYFFYNGAHEYPIIAFFFGVVVGHLFWDITDYTPPKS